MGGVPLRSLQFRPAICPVCHLTPPPASPRMMPMTESKPTLTNTELNRMVPRPPILRRSPSEQRCPMDSLWR